MNKSTSFLRESLRVTAPLAILAAGVLGLVALWSLKEAPAVAPVEVKPPLVETRAVEPHAEGLEIAIDGVVSPTRDVILATQVAGKVVYKSPACEAGKFVTEGTLLLKIDAQDYGLEVARLTKEQAQADATLQEVDLELKNTQALIDLGKEEVAIQQRELQRQLQLRGGAVSPSAIDQARRAELATRRALQTLQNQAQLFESRRNTTEISRQLVEIRLQKSRLDLERTEIKAPVSGVIVEEMVQEDSFVPIGAALAKIEDTSTTEVKCSLKMEELYWLWRQPRAAGDSPYVPAGFTSEEPTAAHEFAGEPAPLPTGKAAYQIPRAPVTVIYEIGGRRFAWQGMLDRFEGIGIDERTRTVPCRVVVLDPRAVKCLDADAGHAVASGPPALVRGMFVRLRIHAQPDATLIHVPEKAIRPGGKVWVVREGKLYIEPISVAAVVDGEATIDADAGRLHAGDRVVVTPLTVVQDGMIVAERRVESSP